MPGPDRIVKDLKRQQAEAAGLSQRSITAALKKTTKQPKGIEVQYQAFLVSYQRAIIKETRKFLPALYSILDLTRDAIRQDDLSDDVVSIFGSIRKLLADLFALGNGVLRLGVTEFGIKTEEFNDEKYNSDIMRLLGIGDVTAQIEGAVLSGWVTENVQLVANMNIEQLGKLETLFLRSLRNGSRSSQVVGDVNKILKEEVTRARLIARDQIGKLNGQLDHLKQTEAGIDAYIWRGALDERERPAHVAREGSKFEWDKPPDDGPPGQAIQCRCNAEPDLSSILGPEFAAEDEPISSAEVAEIAESARVMRNSQARKKRRADTRRKNKAAKAAAAARATTRAVEGP